MQRSGTTVSVSMFGSPDDENLWKIKTVLENSYWANPTEGVFNFQFSTDDNPLTNIKGPMRFNVVRYTPDVYYEAFVLAVPGIMNSDGTFEYGGGRKGMVSTNGTAVIWNDGAIWSRVDSVQKAKPDVIDLRKVRADARLSSVAMGDVIDRYYYSSY